jgi:hypothetical protein
MAVNTDTQQGLKMGLSAVNVANRLSFLTNTEVNGANTYAVLRARVVALINAPGVYTGNVQAGNIPILMGLDQGNRTGILTDTNLSGLTTVAQVQALFTAQAPELPLTYSLSLPQ